MLPTIRTCFDISNTILASYLSISRDMMKSISSGRRAWALDPLWVAKELSDALNLDVPVEELEYVPIFIDQENQQKALSLKKVIKKLENELELSREQLTKLEKLRQVQLRGLNACEVLLQTNLTTHKRQWLEIRKRHLGIKLKENSLDSLGILEVEIIGLEARLSYIKNLYASS